MAKRKARSAKRSAPAKKKKAPQPQAAPTPTPYFIVKDTNAALAFYKKAFGAKTVLKLDTPDGSVMHAEMKINGVSMMLSDEHPNMGAVSPTTLGNTTVQFHIMVKNADAAVKKAVAAGATVVNPVSDQFYGLRSGTVTDPFGYKWMLAHPVEILTNKDIQKRWAKMMKAPKAAA